MLKALALLNLMFYERLLFSFRGPKQEYIRKHHPKDNNDRNLINSFYNLVLDTLKKKKKKFSQHT